MISLTVIKSSYNTSKDVGFEHCILIVMFFVRLSDLFDYICVIIDDLL